MKKSTIIDAFLTNVCLELSDIMNPIKCTMSLSGWCEWVEEDTCDAMWQYLNDIATPDELKEFAYQFGDKEYDEYSAEYLFLEEWLLKMANKLKE